jgi:5-methylcytosine-specific restriction protein A
MREDKDASSGGTVTRRYKIPEIRQRDINRAMSTFDEKYRQTRRWEGFESNTRHRYAIEHNGRRYPVKMIISLATGLPVSRFSGGTLHANKCIAALGFSIVPLHPSDDPDVKMALVPEDE